MRHAAANPIRTYPQSSTSILIFGPDWNDQILEIVIINPDTNPAIIHAMPIRPKFKKLINRRR